MSLADRSRGPVQQKDLTQNLFTAAKVLKALAEAVGRNVMLTADPTQRATNTRQFCRSHLFPLSRSLRVEEKIQGRL